MLRKLDFFVKYKYYSINDMQTKKVTKFPSILTILVKNHTVENYIVIN